MADIDYALRNEVQRLSGQLNQMHVAVHEVGGAVAAVGQKQQETQDALTSLRSRFEQFAAEMRSANNVQLAQTRINTLQDELEHEFGHHKVVRRTAVGMLQAFDVGLVSEETVRAVGEQLMLQTPRYWLAPVLVALAAWAGDDQALCDRAIEEAYRRSPGRTALLMALLLRRQGRRSSAVRWLRHYLDAQDPRALSRDFAVVLESVAQGAFGPAALDLVRERLDGWRELLCAQEDVQRAQIDRWRAELDGYPTASARDRFPRLADISPQWPDLDRALGRAGVHRVFVDRYTALLTEEHAPGDRIEDAIDDILDQLVTEYDDEELPRRRDLAFQESIIEHGGDTEAARRAAVARATALEETRDYLTLQTDSALDPETVGVSRSTQRVAVASCHEWIAQAHAGFTRDYRLGVPERVEAVFETTHSAGAQAFELPRWVGSFTEPIEELEDSLDEHWNTHGQSYVDRFAYDARKQVVLLVLGVLAVLVGLTACANIGVGLIAAGLLGGIWSLVIFQRSQAAATRQDEARALVEQSRQESIRQLRAAGAELVDWTTAYREADGGEAVARRTIAELATAGQPTSPHERRTLDGTNRMGD